MAYFSLFISGFQKILRQPYVSYINKLKMIKWYRFDTDSKNECAIFTRWISFTGPFYISKWRGRVRGQLSAHEPVFPRGII